MRAQAPGAAQSFVRLLRRSPILNLESQWGEPSSLSDGIQLHASYVHTLPYSSDRGDASLDICDVRVDFYIKILSHSPARRLSVCLRLTYSSILTIFQASLTYTQKQRPVS